MRLRAGPRRRTTRRPSPGSKASPSVSSHSPLETSSSLAGRHWGLPPCLPAQAGATSLRLSDAWGIVVRALARSSNLGCSPSHSTAHPRETRSWGGAQEHRPQRTTLPPTLSEISWGSLCLSPQPARPKHSRELPAGCDANPTVVKPTGCWQARGTAKGSPAGLRVWPVPPASLAPAPLGPAVQQLIITATSAQKLCWGKGGPQLTPTHGPPLRGWTRGPKQVTWLWASTASSWC